MDVSRDINSFKSYAVGIDGTDGISKLVKLFAMIYNLAHTKLMDLQNANFRVEPYFTPGSLPAWTVFERQRFITLKLDLIAQFLVNLTMHKVDLLQSMYVCFVSVGCFSIVYKYKIIHFIGKF